MQKISFVKESFKESDGSVFDLNLLCSFDGFSVLVRHSESGDILVFQHYPFKLAAYQVLLRKIRELIIENKLLEQPFRKTTIFFGDKEISMIPESIYSEKLTEYLYPGRKRYETEMETIVIPVRQMGAYLVFKTGKDLFDYLTLRFTGAEITHEIYPIIHSSLVKPATLVHFHMHATWFYAFVSGEEGILMINSFEYKTDSDMLFYMLSVVSQFKMTYYPVTVSGWFDTNDPRMDIIKKYMPQARLTGTGSENNFKESDLVARYLYGIFPE